MSEKLKSDLLGISREAAEALIGSGDGNAALLYLYILRSGNAFDPESASEALKLSKSAAECAFLKLMKLGLAGSPALLARDDAPPDYTAEDVKTRLGESPEFRWLVQETQRRLGRVLSGSDLIILFGIFDYLGLTAEVLLMLITYCIEENRRRYGDGRIPTMRQMEKEAYHWARLGIVTHEQAEEYLRRKIESRDKKEEIKKILGIKNRELSPTEEKYISAWIDMGFELDALELAYDKTIVRTKELSWHYLNRIVSDWHSKGLHTVAEIKEGDSRRETGKPLKSAGAAPTQQEVERMQRYLNKLKQS